jgi:hypothetical protein
MKAAVISTLLGATSAYTFTAKAKALAGPEVCSPCYEKPPACTGSETSVQVSCGCGCAPTEAPSLPSVRAARAHPLPPHPPAADHRRVGRLLLAALRPERVPEGRRLVHRQAVVRPGDARLVEAHAVRAHLHAGVERRVPCRRDVPGHPGRGHMHVSFRRIPRDAPRR